MVPGTGARTVPQRGTAHDGELEALGHERGHDLHRAGLRLDPARGHVGFGVAVLGAHTQILEGLEQTDRARVGPHRATEQLGQVVEVGHVAVALGQRQDPGGDRGLGQDPSDHRRDPLAAQQGAPLVELFLPQGGLLVGHRCDGGGVHTEEPAGAGSPDTARIRRSGDGVEQPVPMGGGLGVEHAVAACDHRGDSQLTKGVAHRRPLGVLGDEYRNIVGAQRPKRDAVVLFVVGDPRLLEKAAHMTCQVGEHHLRSLFDVCGALLRFLASHLVAECRPQGDGRQGTALGVGETAVQISCGRSHIVEGDVVGTEGAAAQEGGGGLQQRRIGAPVGRQLADLGGRIPHGLEIGVHVGAAERVDRLFGVSHHDHRALLWIGRASEEGIENRPLDRIGVLELIYQRNREAGLQSGSGRTSGLRVDQDVAQTDQEVVEGQRAHPGAVRRDPLNHLVGETPQDGCSGIDLTLFTVAVLAVVVLAVGTVVADLATRADEVGSRFETRPGVAQEQQGAASQCRERDV